MKTLVAALSLFCFTGLASAQATFSGTGKVTYVPDIGYINVGVWSEGKNAAEAWEKNREKVQRIFEALRRLGLEARDMQTSNLNVSPQYIHHKDQKPELIGYAVSYDLKVTVRKLDEMGKILDEMVEAGANRQMNISFGIADPEKLLDEARALAIANARKKAEIFAKGAGGRLGAIKTLSENQNFPQRDYVYEHLASSPGKALPLAVGEQDMNVTVYAVWSLVQTHE